MQTLSGDCGAGTGHFYFDAPPYDCEFNSPNTNGIPPIPYGDLASYGDLGRNSLRGPGINNWDISFLKRTKNSESKSVEFRAELFNAFNHVQFLNPGTNGFDDTFGQSARTAAPPGAICVEVLLLSKSDFANAASP